MLLYAKHWYERTNVWEDLKECLTADGHTVFNNTDVLNIIVLNITEDISSNYKRGDFVMVLLKEVNEKSAWKYGYYYKNMPQHEDEFDNEYDHNTAIVHFYLSKMMHLEQDKFINLIRPDSNVLSIRKDANVDGCEWANEK